MTYTDTAKVNRPLQRLKRLIMLPFACCDCDTVIDCVMSCFDVVMKFLGPFLVCIALGLINFISYIVVFVWMPKQDLLRLSFLIPMAIWLYFNIMYNYLRAVRLDAGKPAAFDEDVRIEDPNCVEFGLEEHDEGDCIVETEEKRTPRQCRKCFLTKPERAHHCSVCKRCCLKMDHHCPWINNCVGWNNYRNFCLFMFYLYIGCFFVSINLFHEFQLSWYRRSVESIYERHDRRHLLMVFQITCAVIFSLSILGGFHCFLVLTNQTTIEFQINWSRRSEAKKMGTVYRNPYDIGCARNFQAVFGPHRFWSFRWLLPVEPQRQGDGMAWPSLQRVMQV